MGGKASLLFPSLFAALVLLLLPLSRSVSLVTHLPGFHGRLPFHLETGYVSVDEETGAELFYYFVESERSPDTDPVILWMTGGPFCSGLIFFEVGPMKFVLAPYNGSLPQLAYNPYSWSKTASIILLDSPVGTGFSYARDLEGYRDIGDFSLSLHVLIFLNKWFTDHPRYQSNPFFLGGSSYAGKMSPIIAHHISQEIEQGKQPRINLKGYLVGNPITGSDYDDNFRVPYAHGVGIISDQLYEAAMRNCKGSYIRPTDKMCAMVLNTIANLMSEINQGQILGVRCERGMLTHRFLSEEYTHLSETFPEQPTLNCSDYRYYLCNIWANDDSTRDALGVKQMWGWLHQEMSATFARLVLRFMQCVRWIPLKGHTSEQRIYAEMMPEDQRRMISLREGSPIPTALPLAVIREHSWDTIKWALNEGAQGAANWNFLIEQNPHTHEQLGP